MSSKNQSVVQVSFMRGKETLVLGQLALKNRIIFFEYHPDFIKIGLELSPFKLPLKAGMTACRDQVFDGLFGIFNDSLPDGWGRLLLDRKLMKLSIHPEQLSPLDRLAYVGRSGMGALVYQPEIEGSALTHQKNLDEIASEVCQFQVNDNDQFVEELLAMSGSSAGARPKILTQIDGEEWIIKFRSLFDSNDIGPIEYAYHLMAKEAGLNVPPAKLFASRKGPGYFGVRRFDCINGQRLHMHTVSGLFHSDHRIPNLDYENIMQATLWLTKKIHECEKQFRAAVFNVFACNRDDHAKNFSFLMDKNGVWSVSPAYDLTFSSGPAGEHCTMIMGEGKKPTLPHLLRLAEMSGIKKANALQIIDQVKAAVAKWKEYAKEAGVSATSLKMIQKRLLDITSV